MSPYLLITPCRDEADHLERTLTSVFAQTFRPARWVIVDDGSSDRTPELLEAWAAKQPTLRVVRRADRGRRRVGPGVVDAFDVGLEGESLETYAWIGKLDADLDSGRGEFLFDIAFLNFVNFFAVSCDNKFTRTTTI